MRVNKYLLPVLVIVALLGTVLVARATGYWQTIGRSKVSLKAGVSSAEIKGWMTLADVSEGTGIPLQELRSLLALPSDIAANVALKELEGTICVGEVRAVVGAHLGE